MTYTPTDVAEDFSYCETIDERLRAYEECIAYHGELAEREINDRFLIMVDYEENWCRRMRSTDDAREAADIADQLMHDGLYAVRVDVLERGVGLISSLTARAD